MSNNGFNQSAGRTPTPGHKSSPVIETAKQQIDASNNYQTQLDQHSRDWKTERDKLANSPVQSPMPPPGVYPSPEVAIQRRYNEIRGHSDREGDRIEREHMQKRSDIRGKGETLSDQYKKSTELTPAKPTTLINRSHSRQL